MSAATSPPLAGTCLSNWTARSVGSRSQCGGLWRNYSSRGQWEVGNGTVPGANAPQQRWADDSKGTRTHHGMGQDTGERGGRGTDGHFPPCWACQMIISRQQRLNKAAAANLAIAARVDVRPTHAGPFALSAGRMDGWMAMARPSHAFPAVAPSAARGKGRFNVEKAFQQAPTCRPPPLSLAN
jgi:hypothetical protein